MIIVEFSPEITADARALLLRHRLGAGDAVQLANYLYRQREMEQPLPFVAFDDRLTEAARARGFTGFRDGAPTDCPNETLNSGVARWLVG